MPRNTQVGITLPLDVINDIDFLRGDTLLADWVADLVITRVATWRELGLREATNSAEPGEFLGLVVGNVPKPLRPAYDPVPAHEARRIKQAAKRLQPVNAPEPEAAPEPVISPEAASDITHEHSLGRVISRTSTRVLHECADTSCNWTGWSDITG